MVAPPDLAADPLWVPHAVDPGRKSVAFVRVTPSTLRGGGFLALAQDLPSAEASFDQVRDMKTASGRSRFIFHSGFCLSTLLARSLDVPGRTTVLNEPGILNSLAQMEAPDDALVGAILALLSRPHDGSDAVIVKPSNFANALIPQIMRLRPEARAILMTNSARHYLEAVVRKGLQGRQWGRQAYLHAESYVGPLFRLDMKACAGLTISSFPAWAGC